MSIPLVVSSVCLPGVVIPMQRVGVSIVFRQHARGAAGEQQQVSSSKQQQGAASSRQAAGKQLESWRQKKCYVSIDLLRKIQKTCPYPSQHYENLFLNMLYSCYVRCSLFPHSAFHLFELAKVWRCYVKHIRAPYLSHIRREKAHHPHGTAAIQKSHIR